MWACHYLRSGSAALDMSVTLARSWRSIAEAIPAYMQACCAMCPIVLKHSNNACMRSSHLVPRSSPVGASFITGWTIGYSRAVTHDIFRTAGGIVPAFSAIDGAPISQGIWLTSHQTYKPNVYKRKQCHGFLKRCAFGLIMNGCRGHEERNECSWLQACINWGKKNVTTAQGQETV